MARETVFPKQPSSMTTRILKPLPESKRKFNILVWKLFDHRPHSHDLAPSDYFLFLHLKQWVGGGRGIQHSCCQLVQFPDSELLWRGIKEGGVALRKVLKSERRLCKKVTGFAAK